MPRPPTRPSQNARLTGSSVALPPHDREARAGVSDLVPGRSWNPLGASRTRAPLGQRLRRCGMRAEAVVAMLAHAGPLHAHHAPGVVRRERQQPSTGSSILRVTRQKRTREGGMASVRCRPGLRGAAATGGPGETGRLRRSSPSRVPPLGRSGSCPAAAGDALREGGSRRRKDVSRRSSGFRSTASFLLGLVLLLAPSGCGTAQRASGPTTKSPTAGETSPPAAGQGSATKSPSAGQGSTSKSLDADLSSVDEEMGALDRDLSGADASLRQTDEADPSQ
jgi:hypothetical protein